MKNNKRKRGLSYRRNEGARRREHKKVVTKNVSWTGDLTVEYDKVFHSEKIKNFDRIIVHYFTRDARRTNERECSLFAYSTARPSVTTT